MEIFFEALTMKTKNNGDVRGREENVRNLGFFILSLSFFNPNDGFPLWEPLCNHCVSLMRGDSCLLRFKKKNTPTSRIMTRGTVSATE